MVFVVHMASAGAGDGAGGLVVDELVCLIEGCFGTRLDLAEHFAGHCYVVWCMEVESGKMVGGCVLQRIADVLVCDFPCGDIYYLRSLCVDGGYRKRGIGGLILSKVFESGILNVLHVNKEADNGHWDLVLWYMRHGYDCVSRVLHIPLDPAVECLLVCRNVPVGVREKLCLSCFNE